MDAHNHTLGTFSIYRPFGDAMNVKHDTKSDHACVRLVKPYQFWHGVLPDLRLIRHCAFFQIKPSFLPLAYHDMANFYQALQKNHD